MARHAAPGHDEPSPDTCSEFSYAQRLARMGLWTLHLDPERLDLSPELEEVLGLERGSFRGTLAAFQELVSPLDLPRVQKAIGDSLESGAEYCVNFRFLHRGTEWRWMEARGLPRNDSRESPYAWMASAST